MAKLFKIAETKDIAPGQGGVFEVNGQKIVVFNVDGRFYAVEDKLHGSAGFDPSMATKYFNVRTAGNEIQLEL